MSPNDLKAGQVWDDDLHGTQRVIVRIDLCDCHQRPHEVTYKTEIRHPEGRYDWIERRCYVATFLGWIRKNRAFTR